MQVPPDLLLDFQASQAPKMSLHCARLRLAAQSFPHGSQDKGEGSDLYSSQTLGQVFACWCLGHGRDSAPSGGREGLSEHFFPPQGVAMEIEGENEFEPPKGHLDALGLE